MHRRTRAAAATLLYAYVITCYLQIFFPTIPVGIQYSALLRVNEKLVFIFYFRRLRLDDTNGVYEFPGISTKQQR